MNIGEATAIFCNIYLSDSTVEEKRGAIKTVLDMETHNGITKQEIINALDWSHQNTAGQTIEEQPTAYNVDKVIAELKESAIVHAIVGQQYEAADCIDQAAVERAIERGIYVAIEIVKRGFCGRNRDTVEQAVCGKMGEKEEWAMI